MKKLHTAWIALLLCGCGGTQDPVAPPKLNTASQALVEPNGRFLNGRFLNGRFLNGTALWGVTMRGFATLSLRGSELVTNSNPPLPANKLIGSFLLGQLDDGSNVVLRINDARVDQTSRDIWLYQVSYLDQDWEWNPICGRDSSGASVPATALAGKWDYTEGTTTGGSHTVDPGSFTFACMNAALGECVRWGYAPWRTASATPTPVTGAVWGAVTGLLPILGGVSVLGLPGVPETLANAHQACTRAVRADYCGDGTSYTVNGTDVDFYDVYGRQTSSLSSTTWHFEARWNQAGATCLNGVRHPTMVPPCYSARWSATCGDLTLADGARLLTKVEAGKLYLLNGLLGL
jgi:hypothetical protein